MVVPAAGEHLHEPHAALDEPAGDQQSARPFRSGRTARATSCGSLVMSKASVASVCIRNAISNDSMRASSCSSFCSFSACIALSLLHEVELAALPFHRRELVANVQQHLVERHVRASS